MSNPLPQWWKNWDKYPQVNLFLSLLVLIIVAGVAFFWHLGSTGLVDETEPLFAEAARQMTVTGDWITPHYNNTTRFDKPPLIYWLMAIGYQIIGVNEWAVRLPSALSATALMGLSFYTLRQFGFASPHSAQNREHPRSQRQLWLAALISSILVALNPETIIWARTGVSDMLLTGCMGMALLCFFLGYAGSKGWYWGFYVMLALAVLAKGPVGIVLPGLIIITFLFYVGQFQAVLRESKLLGGLALFFLITVPWYVLVILRNGETYLNSFFGYHNFERFTDVVNGHSAPWYFYFLVVLIGFAPWSIYLPLAITRLRFWRRNWWHSQPRQAHLGLFLLFWFGGIFLFFTVAVTKLPSYVLPLMSAAGMLVGLLWSEVLTGREMNTPKISQGLWWSGVVNVVFWLILAGVIFYSAEIIGRDPAIPNLQELLTQSGIPTLGGVILGITAVVIALALFTKTYSFWLPTINFAGFTTFLLLVLIPLVFFIDQHRQLPLRELAYLAREVEQPGEELVMIGFEKPTLVFYSQRSVGFFERASGAIAYFQDNPQLHTNTSLLLIFRDKYLKKTQLQPEDYQSIARKGAYQLLRVEKEKFLKYQ